MNNLPLNKIILGDCVTTMGTFPDKCIDLTVTSPPYDDLREYHGYVFDFPKVAEQLYRITKDNGVVVWNVGDKTDSNGSESLTSFKQAIQFVEDAKFILHDTMIWFKPNPMNLGMQPRYLNSFEYVFVFSKGRPKTWNPLMVKTVTAGKKYGNVKKLGKGVPIREDIKKKTTNPTKLMANVWEIAVATENYGHSAVYPEELVRRCILSWSNEGEIVFDPFMGSGTTGAVALKTKRHFIGCEIAEENKKLGEQRIKDCLSPLGLAKQANEIGIAANEFIEMT